MLAPVQASARSASSRKFFLVKRINDGLGGLLLCTGAEGRRAGVFQSPSSSMGLTWPPPVPCFPTCPYHEGLSSLALAFGGCGWVLEILALASPLMFPSFRRRLAWRAGQEVVSISVCSRKTPYLSTTLCQIGQPTALCLHIQFTFIENLLCAGYHSNCRDPAVNKIGTGLAPKEFVAEWGDRH